MDDNFDITILEKAGDIFPAMAWYAAQGTTRDQVTIDPKEERLAELLQWAAGAVSQRSADLDAVDDLGRELYRALFGGALGAALNSALQDADAKQRPLRLRLNVADLGILSLPWEFLYDSTRGRRFAVDQETPLVRYLGDFAIFGPTQQLAATLPLRVLMVVPSVPNLDVQGEIDRVREALTKESLAGQRLDLQVLGGQGEEVSLQRLLDRLQEDGEGFDILHFSGHGDTEGGRGNIRFNGDGGEKWVSSQTFAQALKPYAQPQRPHFLRLVVLNACEGGVAAPRAYGARSLLGMAPALIQNEVAAVVAMQYEILDKASLLFARAFYRALTMGPTAGRVDAAVTDARSRLAVEFEGHRSFATPVLFLHAADGRIFDLSEPSSGLQPLSAPLSALSVEDEKLLAQHRSKSPADLRRNLESKRSELATRRFNLSTLQQQIGQLGPTIPLDLVNRARAQEAAVAQLEQEVAETAQLVDIAERMQVPAAMTIDDYLAGRLSDAVLRLFMAPLTDDFDELAIVAAMRASSPPFVQRVSQRLLQKPSASDAELAAAMRRAVGAFVETPHSGFILAPGDKYRHVRY